MTGGARLRGRASLGGRLTEAVWQEHVRRYAVELGWEHFHAWTSLRSNDGYPDSTLVRPPRVIFAELKSDAGWLSLRQAVWLSKLAHLDQVEVYLWRPWMRDAALEVLGPRRDRAPGSPAAATGAVVPINRLQGAEALEAVPLESHVRETGMSAREVRQRLVLAVGGLDVVVVGDTRGGALAWS